MLKRIALILAAVVAVPLFMLVVAAALIPSEQVAALAASRAEAMLGRSVEMRDVELSILPRPVVGLIGVRVAGSGPDDEPLAALESVRLRPRILPLFRRQVVVDELGLAGLRLAVAYDTRGASNLPELSEDSASAPGGGSIRFDVRRLWLEDARLSLTDARDGRVVVLDGYDQTLSLAGAVSRGRLDAVALEGSVQVDSVAARMAGDSGWTVRNLRMGLTHDARYFSDAGRLELDSVRLTVQQVTLAGAGTVTGIGQDSAPVLDLRLAAESFDIAELLRSLPGGLLPAGDEDAPELAGTAAVTAVVRGAVGLESLPRIVGEMRFRDVSAARDGAPIVRDLAGTLAFDNDSVSSDGVTGRLLGEPLRIAFSARDPVDPVVRFDVDAGVVVERARRAGLLPEDAPAVGGRFGLVAAGTLTPSRPAESTLRGTLAVRDFSMTPESATVALRVPAADLALTTDSVRAEGVSAFLGQQRIAIDFAVGGWLPAALGDTTGVPGARADLRARRLDLEPLLGPAHEPAYSQLLFARMSGGPIDGRDPAELAAERGTQPLRLPRLNARVRLRVDTLTNAGVRYTDLDARLLLSPDRLEVERATFGIMGGAADVAAVLTPIRHPGDSPSSGTHVSARGTVQGVAAAPFLTRFTTFRDRMTGTLDLEGATELVLDARMLPERDAVRGTGGMTLRDGQLVAWPILGALGQRLGAAAFDTLRLRELVGGIEIAGPMVRLGEAGIAAGGLDARLAGSFTFAGQLDLAADARIPASVAARAGVPGLQQAASAAAGEQGDVPVGVRIGGTWRSPDVALDLSAARRNLVERAQEEGRRQADRLAEQGAAALADRLGLQGDTTGADTVSKVDALRQAATDSATAAVDSARRTIESNVRDRLKGLF